MNINSLCLAQNRPEFDDLFIHASSAGTTPTHATPEPRNSCAIVTIQDEADRLKTLYQYQVLDTDPDPELDELTILAAEICQTPIALISFVDRDRQWFKSKVGINLCETPRYVAFCSHAIQQSNVFVVPDALDDPRFVDNPLVVDYPNLRFYAGTPLINADGFALGTLCVVDYQPRQLSQQQIRQLQILGHQVMAQLELKRDALQFQRMRHDFDYLQKQFVECESLSHQESIVFNLANQIRTSLDLDTILKIVVQEVRTLIQADYCYFVWCLPNGDNFSLAITHEAKNPERRSLQLNQHDYVGMLSQAIAQLSILQIDHIDQAKDLSSNTQEFLIEQGICSQLLIPLKTYSGQLGAIVCNRSDAGREWTSREVQLLQGITNQLAIALDQAELFAQTRSTALAAQAQAQYLAEALQKLQQTQAQLVQHEKMSSLGQLVAGVAHEINNPLNFINGNINYARDYIQDLLDLLGLYKQHYPEPGADIQTMEEAIDLNFVTEDLPNLLASMKMGVERICQIVISLRNFSRLDESDMKTANLHEGLDNTLLILKSRLKANGLGNPIQIHKFYDELPMVECYPGQLNQVFMNILSNAIDALDGVEEPAITIATEMVLPSGDELTPNGNGTDAEIPKILIRIKDNGVGMPEAVRQKIFNPFYTTKPVGKGTGLGLSISYQIVVEKHGGQLECFSNPGDGTEFIIQIPIQSQMCQSTNSDEPTGDGQVEVAIAA